MSLCQGCHSGCCRSFAVPITGADMIRLERETGKTFWDFGCRWADESGAIAGNYAPHFHFQDEPSTPFVICLKHEESDYHPGTARCQFLQESPPDATRPVGAAHCGIYNGRPAACRVFPTKYDVGNELPIIYPVPEYGRAEQRPEYRLCPRQWSPEDVDSLEVAQDLAVARYEIQFFHRLAEMWNRHAGAWEIFPDFLRDVYQRRITLMPEACAQPELTPEELSAEEEEYRRNVVKMPRPASNQREAA
ncbi:MAG: YkgJ family cysteine cluster protein [Planctomycetaceae bacterium]|nr:YkgJ family cysteine cluster protein [Planctomycetaceae bacterium]